MDDGHTFQLSAGDGTKLFARQWDATNPHATLAVVHGFGEHSGRYAPMAEHLTANGIQVIATDLRGHGRSDGKRGVIHSYDDFRADLAALLDRARQVHGDHTGPLVLFGHSMGGGVVLDHGLSEEPGVSGIIASAPLVALAQPVSGATRLAAKCIGKVLPNAAMKQPIDGTKISTLPAEQAAYMEDPLNHGQMGFRTAVELVETGETLTEKAANWSLPLLMLHATEDQLTDFKASQDFATKARADFRAIPDVAHEAHNDESRAQVYAAITDFIDLLSGRV